MAKCKPVELESGDVSGKLSATGALGLRKEM